MKDSSESCFQTSRNLDCSASNLSSKGSLEPSDSAPTSSKRLTFGERFIESSLPLSSQSTSRNSATINYTAPSLATARNLTLRTIVLPGKPQIEEQPKSE
jgi:hypothetical protein